MSTSDIRPPVPPFTAETALKKVKAAQDLWNTKDPEKVALAYTVRPLSLFLYLDYSVSVLMCGIVCRQIPSGVTVTSL